MPWGGRHASQGWIQFKKRAEIPAGCRDISAAERRHKILGYFNKNLNLTGPRRRDDGTGGPGVPTEWTRTREVHREPNATRRGRKSSCSLYESSTFL